MNESGILTALEQLLEEFFNPATSNIKKREIEAQLEHVKNLPNFGKLCLFITSNTSSQLATMFALSSLEVSSIYEIKLVIIKHIICRL